MEQIRFLCQHPDCPCGSVCCQDCGEMVDCCEVCSRIQYQNAVYNSNVFLVQQMEELAGLSGHWLIKVAAQRLKSMDLALGEQQPLKDSNSEMAALKGGERAAV